MPALVRAFRMRGGDVGPILACKGCGATKPEPTGDPSDLFPSERCGDCPAWRCEDCGEMCSAASLCPCWTRLDTLPMADIKALFAADGLDLAHDIT